MFTKGQQVRHRGWHPCPGAQPELVLDVGVVFQVTAVGAAEQDCAGQPQRLYELRSLDKPRRTLRAFGWQLRRCKERGHD